MRAIIHPRKKFQYLRTKNFYLLSGRENRKDEQTLFPMDVSALRSRARSAFSSIYSQIDADGDGNLTLEEVQEATRRVLSLFVQRKDRLKTFLNSHHNASQLSFSLFLLLYGGNFTHLYLGLSAFGSAQGAEIKAHFDELLLIGGESVQRLGKDTVLVGSGEPCVESKPLSCVQPDIAGGGGEERSPRELILKAKTVSVPPTLFIALLRCIDPQKVLNCVRALYSGFLAAFLASVNENAAKFGLGLSLGSRISVFLLSVVEGGARQKLSSLSAEIRELQTGFSLQRLRTLRLKLMDSVRTTLQEMQSPSDELETKESSQDVEVPLELVWRRVGVKAVCTSLGLLLSWRLKDAAATWSVCHLAGVKFAEALFRLLKVRDAAMEQVLGAFLGWWGMARHVKAFNRPQMPILLRLLLFPLVGLEGILKGVAISGETAEAGSLLKGLGTK